jgi:Rab-GTPase-TBC domain
MEINSPCAKKWLKFSANNLQQKFWGTQWNDYYQDKLKSYNGHMEDFILKDVERSAYTLSGFPRLQKKFRNELMCVLHAYSAYDPELGYTQGMSFIIERLLAHLTDYQTFIVWLGILKTDDFRSFYTEQFGDRLNVAFKGTCEDIRIKFPEMCLFIKKLVKKYKGTVFGCDGTYNEPLLIFYGVFTQICMTLGCNLPIENTVKDQIITEFLQNRNKTFTTTTLIFGVIAILEKHVYTLRSVDDLYLLLNSQSLDLLLKDQDILKEGINVRERYPILLDFDMD